MKTTRKIIEIDEELCTGCGQCILACAEGALELVDGKARMVGEVFCDGLGACIGDCPEGALRIIEREADAFDEDAVEERLKTLEAEQKPPAAPPMCPSLKWDADDEPAEPDEETKRNLSQVSGESAAVPVDQWPLKLQLLSPEAPFLKGKDLLLVADCAAFALPGLLHSDTFRGHSVALACPKFEDHDAHVSRLAAILQSAGPASVTVVRMEVPCCGGYEHAVLRARDISGADIPIKRIVVGRGGKVIEYKDIPAPAKA